MIRPSDPKILQELRKSQRRLFSRTNSTICLRNVDSHQIKHFLVGLGKGVAFVPKPSSPKRPNDTYATKDYCRRSHGDHRWGVPHTRVHQEPELKDDSSGSK